MGQNEILEPRWQIGAFVVLIGGIKYLFGIKRGLDIKYLL